MHVTLRCGDELTLMRAAYWRGCGGESEVVVVVVVVVVLIIISIIVIVVFPIMTQSSVSFSLESMSSAQREKSIIDAEIAAHSSETIPLPLTSSHFLMTCLFFNIALYHSLTCLPLAPVASAPFSPRRSPRFSTASGGFAFGGGGCSSPSLAPQQAVRRARSGSNCEDDVHSRSVRLKAEDDIPASSNASSGGGAAAQAPPSSKTLEEILRDKLNAALEECV